MDNQKRYEEVQAIGDLIGIKLAPLEMCLSYYPDEFRGMEFHKMRDEGANVPRAKYSAKMQNKLIRAFRSHDWLVSSDIYGHQGLSSGGSCKKCGRKFKFPEPEYDLNLIKEAKSSDKQDWRRRFERVSDDFILTYHYLYGSHARFGGRITKCPGKKRKK